MSGTWTRFRVTDADMAALERLRNLRVTLLFTYSGITDPRVEPIAKSAITLTSLGTACRARNRTKAILYWRPIVPGWNDDPATMARVLDVGRDADAIVFTGYYHKVQNAEYLRSLGVDVPYSDGYDRRKVMPAELDEKVIAAWRESGASVPLFRKTSCGSHGDWTTAQLVALDLEGSGAQDRDSEAILEISVVPITAGQPDMPAAYPTLVNPGRAIPRRPWISPGLTADALAGAPGPAEVGPELARRVDGQAVVGHNVSVDWRLLHRRYPAIAPTALIDTLRLARSLNLESKNSLSALTDHLGLTGQVERLAAGSQPHRALWDTVATALLLPALVAIRWPTGTTLSALMETAAILVPAGPARPGATSVQDTLFGPA